MFSFTNHQGRVSQNYNEISTYTDTIGIRPSTSEGEKLQNETNLANILILYFQSQDCEEIDFCCLNQSICGIYHGSPSKLSNYWKIILIIYQTNVNSNL